MNACLLWFLIAVLRLISASISAFLGSAIIIIVCIHDSNTHGVISEDSIMPACDFITFRVFSQLY